MSDSLDTKSTALTGQVVRIVYSDPDSGFTIAKLQIPDHGEPVTITGPLMSPAPGQTVSLKGRWIHHPKFGQQFKAEHIESRIPTTKLGVEAYLGSGQIKGIGRQMAQRIVSRFGEKAIDIIEHNPEKLQEVPGIGPKRVARIVKTWEDQRHIRNVMLFMQSYGVSPAYAVRIFKQYGQDSISVVQQNPYRLADDIFGIGFKIADRIGAKLGISKNTPLRLQAGVVYTLTRLSDEGHLFFPYEALIGKAQELLQGERHTIESAISAIAGQKKIIIEALASDSRQQSSPPLAVFLAGLHRCETFVSKHLLEMQAANRPKRTSNALQSVEWVQQRFKVALGRDQKRAIGAALSNNVLVITGGPGTGKTTIVRAITRIYEHLNTRVLLAAPTGRAAKRLSEASGRPAKTIHRLLAYNPSKGEFGKNANEPLDADLLIVDEASMVDIGLMYCLLKAVRLSTTLILVGDVNQLPPVGPGQVLKDILASQTIPRVILHKIFRQARNSEIVLNAHRINAGRMPLDNRIDKKGLSDFYFIEQQEPERILETILNLVSRRIPDRFELDPVDDIQVLTPMHRGILGSEKLNQTLQQRLNPQDAYVARGDVRFGMHDKVMQIRNNYDKDVFNGDLGRVSHIDPHSRKVVIQFDSGIVDYDFNEMEELVLAYAISVHKSQGSEYPAVVIPMTTAHYVLLQRNLIYTALTRARQLVVMVGTKRALAMAIKNDQPQKRYTLLAHRLSGVQ